MAGYSLSDALNRPRAGRRHGAQDQLARHDAASSGRTIAAKRPAAPRGPSRVRPLRPTRPATSASPPMIVVRPTAPRWLSTGRYSLEGARESWEAERPERQARTLRMLRAAFAEGEEALVGWAAITM